MDPRQRLGDLPTAIDMVAKARQAQMWTALPGIIQSFNAEAMTCEVQPSLQGVLSDPKTGQASNANLPLLVDCPVCFPGWGGVSLTFPIAPGDECLVVFASRCIDAWWQSGGVQPQMAYRMHDLSDGFVVAGVRSQPRVLSDISTTAAQLRSDDGETFVELNPAGNTVKIKAPAGLTVDAPEAVFTGNVKPGSGISGTITTSTGQVAMFQNGILTSIY